MAGADAGIELAAGPLGRVSVAERQPVPPGPLPIDAVYTWVDGSDPAWRARKEERLHALSAPHALHPESSNPARYEPIDELRYSLRSLESYAPWFQSIYLVTDRQRPTWLSEDHPRLTIVDHREIFRERAALPTFNSHAIETQLHHINGLAEHWVYFNDDVLLGRSILPSLFFDQHGRPRVFLAPDEIDPGPPRAEDPPVVVAAKNNRAVLHRLTGRALSHKLKHVPHPQLRSVSEELERMAREEFDRTARSPFRDTSDISFASSLAPLYAHATGRAILGSVDHFYADVGSPELRWRLGPLLESHAADVICLNATSTTASAAAERISAFLARYFPLPSGFE
ncbi:MAG: Stealth CR1 domain-containing protein, partial [Actinomycetes bacterium]|nr:Stealth CR1 domain-containing protein [Actinomycetes bacterium]MDX5450324.1 Stealth CR1 domain-containing protein [Actinomycetes bacterium]